MNKQAWIIVGLVAVAAVATGLIVRHRTTPTDSAQSQLPAESAEANYTVPPDIGASVDNTGGVNLPNGGSGITYTTGAANSMPLVPTPYQS